ncbi:MAG TPA: FecR family protein [Usitatibacter sp.]|nr:FecR family protein [Usitatibacter sp.]
MSRIIALGSLIALLAAPLAGWAQELAARVVAVAGDVSVARAAQRLPAAVGMEIFSGDTVDVAAGGAAQLRFTDEGIVALRSASSFKVAEYTYADPARGRAFFELLKGGLRTVTGGIGRQDPSRYRLKTLHANVGIRGTGFSVIACEASCPNADGTLAPDGTYGAVTEGRVAVANQGGEAEFGAEEYFYVADFYTAPQALMGPPSFLVPKRARATAAQAAARGGAAASAAASGAPTEAPIEALPATIAAALPAVGFQAASGSPTTLLSQGAFGGTSFYHVEGSFAASSECACATTAAGEVAVGVNYALGLAGLVATIRDDSGRIFNVSTVGAGMAIRVVGSTATFGGTFNLADFPQNQGAFRCSTCGPGGTPGFATQMVVNGTIVGDVATVTITLVSSGGTFTVTSPVPLSAPPNNLVGAMSLQRQSGGVDVRSAALWNLDVDAAGHLTRFGPVAGGPAGRLGSATATITGRAPDAGNLVWGRWSTGATITDSNYATFTSTTQSVWITGENSNTLPPSLGQVVFTPVGFTSSGGNQVLNSATLTADFVNRSIALDINATNVTAGNTFQMNGATSFSSTTGRFSAGFVTINCSGPCTGTSPLAGAYAGFIAGSRAQGAGVVFSAGYGPGSGVTGVMGMGRR